MRWSTAFKQLIWNLSPNKMVSSSSILIWDLWVQRFRKPCCQFHQNAATDCLGKVRLFIASPVTTLMSVPVWFVFLSKYVLRSWIPFWKYEGSSEADPYRKQRCKGATLRRLHLKPGANPILRTKCWYATLGIHCLTKAAAIMMNEYILNESPRSLCLVSEKPRGFCLIFDALHAKAVCLYP